MQGFEEVDGPEIWSQLGDDARAALGWAAAMEALSVGTRTLLIGIIRAGDGDSDPEQLLRVFGCPKERLFRALQGVAPKPTINPDIAQPAELNAMPKLSPNCKRVLERAVVFKTGREGASRSVNTRHVFAAMLDFRQSTAYRALRDVLDADLEEVRRLYVEHLRDPDAGRLEEALLRRYPDRAEPAAEPIRFEHSGAVNALLFSPDGFELASAGADGVIGLSYPRDRFPPRVLWEESSTAQTALAYSPDERHFAAGDAAGVVRVWGAEDPQGPSIAEIGGFLKAIRAIAFAPDGMVAIGDEEGSLLILTPEFGRLSEVAGAPGKGIVALSFSPDSGMLASADENGGLSLWNPKEGEELGFHRPSNESNLAVGFEPDEGMVTLVLIDGTVVTWDHKREFKWNLRAAHPGGGQATAATLSADSDLALSAHRDDSLRLANLAEPSGTPPRVLGHHLAPIASVALSPDGKWAASGGSDGKVRIWPIGARASRDHAVDWQVDSPARGVEGDELGREQLAAALARRLRQISDVDAGDSFLLHLDGPWGAGKSTILGLLEQELERDEEHWMVVEFDAWRQSRVGPPWWAMLTSLRTALRKTLGPLGRARLRLAETAHRLGQAWLSYAISLAVVAVAIAVFFVLDPVEGNVGEAFKLVSGAIAVLTSIWLLGRTAARSFMWESATAARLYEQAHQEPMEVLARHFGWLMARTERRVAFFIDDLDRCDERYVVDLLDSVQTLVRDAPTTTGGHSARPPYFVVAADGRWIRCSYEHVYEAFEDAVREPGRPLGYLFLDKIFQLTVQVPTIGGERQRTYMNHLLRRGQEAQPRLDEAALAERKRQIHQSSSQEAILEVVEDAPAAEQPQLRAEAVRQLSTPQVAANTEHELQKFAALLEPNPRSMKRFVNAYSVALSTALLEERSLDPDQLALWTVLRMRWPELAAHLGRCPESLAGLKSPTGDADGIPETLAALVGDRSVIRVLSFGKQPLEESTVRALHGAVEPEDDDWKPS